MKFEKGRGRGENRGKGKRKVKKQGRRVKYYQRKGNWSHGRKKPYSGGD